MVPMVVLTIDLKLAMRGMDCTFNHALKIVFGEIELFILAEARCGTLHVCQSRFVSAGAAPEIGMRDELDLKLRDMAVLAKDRDGVEGTL